MTINNQTPKITDILGRLPYRMALAGGWIDQPFVSRLNPRPPGSMVVVCARARRSASWTAPAWHRHPQDRAEAVERRAARARSRPTGARAVRRGEPGQGGALRLAGHDRPDLSRRQPAGLRLRLMKAASFRDISSRTTTRKSLEWLEQVIHMLPVESAAGGLQSPGDQESRPARGSAAWGSRARIATTRSSPGISRPWANR